MAITYRGGGEASAINGGDPTITFPGGVAENDIVLAGGGHGLQGTTAATILTSGYTQLELGPLSSTADVAGCWYKRMGATPDSTVQGEGGGNGSDAVVYLCQIFIGVDTTTAIDATTTEAASSSGAPDSPNIDTVTDGAAVVSIGVGGVFDSTVTSPSGYGDQVHLNRDDTRPVTAGMAWVTKATAGGENPAAWTGWSTGTWAAFTVALRPATGGGALSLALDSVAWTSSVTAVSLELGREIVPESVAWASTVTDVTLNKGKTIAPDTVAWSWAATDTSLEHGKEIVPEAVAWSWTITDAALERGWELVPDSVGWSWSVADASLEHGYELIPEALDWTWSAGDVTLTHGGTSAQQITPTGGLPLSYKEWARRRRKDEPEEDAPPKPRVIEKIGVAQPVVETKAFIPSPPIETGLSELTKSEIRRRIRLAKKRRQEEDWFILN